ncbi:MAG: hypothetical protein KIT35_12475 [Piscinibacter sp.]|nr:hypothetical protein [Piscinibacter sp.]MCW5664642.1 hypothetical protein [Piscinibacter sp.]MCW5664645.1 hypothetical protein [Piscinibacter sp.]
MNPSRVASTALLGLLTLHHLAQAATADEIEVRLFYAQSGTFSEPISEGAELWNVIAGEQGLREPSTSTFVRVRVSESGAGSRNAGRVVLTVTDQHTKKRSILTKHLGAFGPNGVQYVGFWLPNTGCASLRIEAAIAGTASAVARNIPFRCGE